MPPPQRVWFLSRFRLHTGLDFAHFGLELGMVFEETTGMYERQLSSQFQTNKKERKIREFEMDFKQSLFVCILIQVMMTKFIRVQV